MYPKNLIVWNLIPFGGPAKNVPYSRKFHISEFLITGIGCTERDKCHLLTALYFCLNDPLVSFAQFRILAEISLVRICSFGLERNSFGRSLHDARQGGIHSHPFYRDCNPEVPLGQSGRGKGTGIGCVKSALGNLPLPQMRHSLWKCTWVVTCHRVTHFLGSRDRLMVQLLWQIWLQAGLLKGSMDLRGSVLEEFLPCLLGYFRSHCRYCQFVVRLSGNRGTALGG